jgi:hypothetical protein
MNLTLQGAGSHESESPTVGESWGVMGFIPHGHLDGGPSLRVARASASCAALSAVFSPQSSLLHSTMARGKGKTKQSSLQSAGMLPTLKKPAEAVGHFMTSCTCPASSAWERCAAADKKKIYKCLVRVRGPAQICWWRAALGGVRGARDGRDGRRQPRARRRKRRDLLDQVPPKTTWRCASRMCRQR